LLEGPGGIAAIDGDHDPAPQLAQRSPPRKGSSLPQKLQEMVMISVAREMSCASNWYAHAAAPEELEAG